MLAGRLQRIPALQHRKGFFIRRILDLLIQRHMHDGAQQALRS